jgi:hypothetical protein
MVDEEEEVAGDEAADEVDNADVEREELTTYPWYVGTVGKVV